MKKFAIFLVGIFFNLIVSASGTQLSISSIKNTVQNARPYDTLLIPEGLYTEHSITIDKPLTLIAKGKVVLDAEQQPYNIFIISSDSVTISGFHLRNVGTSFLEEIAAVMIRDAKYSLVQNNTIINCFFGIYIGYGSYLTISKNVIKGSFQDESSAGNAIHAWKGDHLYITQNIVRGHRDGIYFEFINDSFIENNKSYNNLRYGLHFMFSNRDEYRKNIFEDNGAGVAVMFSKHIKMIENRFVHNWGGAAYGLLLKEISRGAIRNNYFIQNTVGILAEGASYLTISQNQFTQNGTALDMKGNSLDNRVEANNFLANTFEVVTNTKYSNNVYHKNYWSGYKGYDLNRDGYGDVPYRPVNLFAKITHEIPSANIMLHSGFVNLLEVGEKIFPQLIPEELIDPSPRMKPYVYDSNQ